MRLDPSALTCWASDQLAELGVARSRSRFARNALGKGRVNSIACSRAIAFKRSWPGPVQVPPGDGRGPVVEGVRVRDRGGPPLEAVLLESGAPIDGFRAYASGPGRAEHDELNRAAFDAGVFGVPTYLVGDEMWFGREHLPRVAWLLGGSTGPAPDVANRTFDA